MNVYKKRVRVQVIYSPSEKHIIVLIPSPAAIRAYEYTRIIYA